MTSKLRAERLGPTPELVAVLDEPAVVDPGSSGERERERSLDHAAEHAAEIEAEVLSVAAWFGALPPDLRAHFDREAQRGREAYRWP